MEQLKAVRRIHKDILDELKKYIASDDGEGP